MSITQQLSNSSVPLSWMAFSSRESGGVTVLVIASSISLIAVIGALFAILLSAFNTRTIMNQHLFARTHVAGYFISLLLCYLVRAIGSLINIGWLQRKGIPLGDLCIAQGTLKHISDVGTALWTMVIAGQTFLLLFLEIKTRPFVLWITLATGWSIIGGIVIFGPALISTDAKGPFYGISGYWCWISPAYSVQRITLDYMLMFIAAGISFLFYTAIFLRLRGNIVRNGWRIRLRNRSDDSAEWRGRQLANGQAMAIAKQMLLYPASYFSLLMPLSLITAASQVAYTVLILPIAAARLAAWSGHNVPFEVTIFGATVFHLAGLINVVLFLTTRRVLPQESLRVGRWCFSRAPDPRPSSLNTPSADQYHTPIEDDDVEKGLTHVITLASDGENLPAKHFIAPLQIEKKGKRPIELKIRSWDSVDKIYDAYLDREIVPPAMSSHWSPDTPPLKVKVLKR